MGCLHVFDMDGTLLRGSACLEISRALGVYEQTLSIEEAWWRGEITDLGFWQRCLPLWAGLTDADVDRAFEHTQWFDGVQAVFGDIRARAEHSVVITQSPRFFAQRICRWGASFAFGAEVTPGDTDGAHALISSADKLKITDRLLRELGLERTDCVAYGDSTSDLALFETLSHTVAVNAKHPLRELARATYDGPDLWQAYLAGRRLLERRDASS